MRAFTALPRFTPDAQGQGMKAWLLRILRNIHTDRVRANASRISPQALSGSESEDLAARADSSAIVADVGDVDALLQSFSDQTVIDALLALPVDIRWTLLLADVEGLDHAQVAEILEIPVGTVKSRVSRGRGMLRQHLVAPIGASGGKP